MRQPRAADPSPTWRERIDAFHYIPPFLRLVWETHRGYTLTMVLLRIARAFVPVAALWVGKLIIDEVIALRSGSPDLTLLWELVGLEIIVVVAGEVLARASALIESLLGDLFSNLTSIRLMEHAATLDLYHFEDSAFYDQLERARRQTVNRIGLLARLLSVGQDTLTLASLGTALFVYNPWLLLLLVVAVGPSLLGETHFASLEYSLLYRWTPERRRLDYLRYVGASDKTAKEVQLFGLAPWLIERYRVISERFYRENKKLSIRKGIVSTALSMIGTAGYYGAYVVILLRAVSGAISIGSLTFLAGSFARSRDLIQRLLLGASEIYEQCLYLKDLFGFFEMKPSIATHPGAPPVPQPIREGFVYDDVGFRYPGSDRWAVRHVNFRLRPGERIALVGENGAGKTTLTKLLSRLYDPTEGRILLDGVDLKEYDLGSLRRAVGVIFQDFVQYDFRFDENIGVGEITRVQEYLDATEGVGLGPGSRAGPPTGLRPDTGAAAPTGGNTRGAPDLHPDLQQAAAAEPAGPVPPAASSGAATAGRDGSGVPPEIASAAEKSLAAGLLERFAAGYRQMLGRRFEQGVELSGGEWQKVALARAYMRNAQILILDEPTAALDARAEYEVFTRFSGLVAGRMAVIISHRFSTVRMAQRIIVLQGGQVVEQGSHEELMANGKLYAELFTLQAQGYR